MQCHLVPRTFHRASRYVRMALEHCTACTYLRFPALRVQHGGPAPRACDGVEVDVVADAVPVVVGVVHL